MTWQRRESPSASMPYYWWQLDRPAPALPNSHFWTWDHSTNWVLDDPGIQTSGCYNPYLKRPETYVEDYRRLTDMAAGLGIKGIIIWGFLRDSHGGVEYARRVASYAAQRGVAIMPGVGTTWYGGAYYEGDSPHSLTTFLREHPDARMLDQAGRPVEDHGGHGACPAHPAYAEWLHNALDWLFREFPIGGVNLENGDLQTDYHPLTQARRKDWPADDPEPFFFQGLSYQQALDAITEKLPDHLCTYATYTGFGYGDELVQNQTMGTKPPAMLRLLPAEAVCQWTLTGMILQKPLPLTAYLDDGAPAAAFENPGWPVDLRPPCARSVGFIHQGSQWCTLHRYQCVVSSIKEACLRAWRSGLEGVSIHGEVSSRCIPSALNYLAFSHFVHWPEDSMRQFGRKTLGQVLGSEDQGEAYAEILSHWDAGTLSDAHKKQAPAAWREAGGKAYGLARQSAEQWQRSRLWGWLDDVVARAPADTAGLGGLGPVLPI